MKKTVLDQTTGQKLRDLRLSRKLTIKLVATPVGLSVPGISEFERDICTPSIKTLRRLCKFYNITLSKFFSNIVDREVITTNRGKHCTCKNRGNVYCPKNKPKCCNCNKELLNELYEL